MARYMTTDLRNALQLNLEDGLPLEAWGPAPPPRSLLIGPLGGFTYAQRVATWLN